MAPSDSKLPPLRHGATPAEQQAYALQKLLANPDKPVHIPEPPPEGVRQLRAPREMMKNVQGSSAGAGSGEFHVYKQSRRREYERLKIMDEEEAYLEAKTSAEQRQLESQTAAELKTAKNRLKRQRKKAGRKGGKSKEDGSDDEGPTPAGEEGEKKRKLGGGAAGGSGFRFMTKEEREAEGEAAGEEEEREEKSRREEKEEMEKREEEQVKAAKEAGITVRDED